MNTHTTVSPPLDPWALLHRLTANGYVLKRTKADFALNQSAGFGHCYFSSLPAYHPAVAYKFNRHCRVEWCKHQGTVHDYRHHELANGWAVDHAGNYTQDTP